ncbi:MAG: hypothetical protein ACKO9S_02970 [Bacteroidota bacterium]
MKLFFKPLIVFIFFQMLMPSTQASILVKPIDSTSCFTAMKPKVTICFTIARKRDCEGFGICNFHAIVTEGRFNNAVATAYKDDYSNALVFEIDRYKGLASGAYDRYFKSGYFVMEDDSQVPSDILSTLGISSNATLLQGKYPIMESNGMIRFVIPYR